MLRQFLNLSRASAGYDTPSMLRGTEEQMAKDLTAQFSAISEYHRKRIDKVAIFIGQVLNVPCVAIMLDLDSKQRRIAGFGIPEAPSPRSTHFMDLTRNGRDVVVIENTLEDERFANHRLVAGAPHVRSSISAPMLYENGWFVGHVIAWDVQPRKFSAHEIGLMRSLTSMVVDELELDRKIAESSSRMKLLEGIFENAAVGISVNTIDGKRIAVNRRLSSIVAVPEEQLLDEPVWSRIHPDDRADGQSRLQQLVDGKIQSYQREQRYIRNDGSVTWARTSISKMNDENGPEPFIVAVIEDIDARRQAEIMRNLLLGEVNHRVKNTLAIIQGIAKQLLRTTISPEQFSQAFETRIQALAKSHDMLTEESWRPLPLDKIVENLSVGSWAPYGNKLKFSGCTVDLNAQTTIMLSLLLHELLTNAIKHGALQAEGGWIDLVATLEQRDEERWMKLVWCEHGAKITSPSKHKGLGSYLVERGVRLGLSGEGRMEFRPTGVRCELFFPIFADPRLDRSDLRS